LNAARDAVHTDEAAAEEVDRTGGERKGGKNVGERVEKLREMDGVEGRSEVIRAVEKRTTPGEGGGDSGRRLVLLTTTRGPPLTHSPPAQRETSRLQRRREKGQASLSQWFEVRDGDEREGRGSSTPVGRAAGV
jgi:hypothetical protein